MHDTPPEPGRAFASMEDLPGHVEVDPPVGGWDESDRSSRSFRYSRPSPVISQVLLQVERPIAAILLRIEVMPYPDFGFTYRMASSRWSSSIMLL